MPKSDTQANLPHRYAHLFIACVQAWSSPPLRWNIQERPPYKCIQFAWHVRRMLFGLIPFSSPELALENESTAERTCPACACECVGVKHRKCIFPTHYTSTDIITDMIHCHMKHICVMPLHECDLDAPSRLPLCTCVSVSRVKYTCAMCFLLWMRDLGCTSCFTTSHLQCVHYLCVCVCVLGWGGVGGALSFTCLFHDLDHTACWHWSDQLWDCTWKK